MYDILVIIRSPLPSDEALQFRLHASYLGAHRKVFGGLREYLNLAVDVVDRADRTRSAIVLFSLTVLVLSWSAALELSVLLDVCSALLS